MLKFENTANIGDVIKAYDFKPMSDRPDMFLTGRVVAKGPMYGKVVCGDEELEHYIGEGYTVEIIGGDAESVEMGRIGIEAYVPFEVSITEFDGRVELVATEAEVEMLIAYETEEVMH